jgi:hypothetical protein
VTALLERISGRVPSFKFAASEEFAGGTGFADDGALDAAATHYGRVIE